MDRRLPLLLLLGTAGCGTDVTGPTPSLFSCLLTDPRSIEAGQVLQVRGAAHQGLCLESTTGGDYLYIPFFGRESSDDDEEVRLELELTALGVDPPSSATEAVTAPPSLLLGPSDRSGSRLRPDADFHDRLRARERRQLEPRIRAAAPPGADPNPWMSTRDRTRAQAAPAPGTLIDYNVAISCTDARMRTGRVEYVSETAIVVADVSNPSGMSSSDFRHFAETFDTLVYPVDTAHFGMPADLDGNGRIVIFFTSAVNELTEVGSDTYTGGFFWSGDLFPETATDRLEACPAANQAEMFYMLVADPLGSVGPAFTIDFIRQVTVPILAHELQHLINASRRLYVNEASTFERGWLNEGLSHIAEELLFYRAAGLAPGSNLTTRDLRDAPGGVAAFNRYLAGGNFTNLLRYLQEPDTASLMGTSGLDTRGATWAFLRYAADRSGREDADFFRDLVNSRVAGLANLGAVLGDPALDWMQDWTVAVYADDEVAGVERRHTQPSWNYRDIYGEVVGGYPLALIALSAGSHRLELQPGGAAFPWLSLPPEGRAVLHVESGGDAPPPSLRGSYLRIR